MYAYEVPLLMNLCSEVLYAHEYAPNAFVPAPQCRHTVCSAHCVRCTSAHVCCAVRVFGCVSGSKGLGILNTYTEARKTTAGTRGGTNKRVANAGHRWPQCLVPWQYFEYWLIRLPHSSSLAPLSGSDAAGGSASVRKIARAGTHTYREMMLFMGT